MEDTGRMTWVLELVLRQISFFGRTSSMSEFTLKTYRKKVILCQVVGSLWKNIERRHEGPVGWHLLAKLPENLVHCGIFWSRIHAYWNDLEHAMWSIAEYCANVEYSWTNLLSDLVELGKRRNTDQCTLIFCAIACTAICTHIKLEYLFRQVLRWTTGDKLQCRIFELQAWFHFCTGSG